MKEENIKGEYQRKVRALPGVVWCWHLKIVKLMCFHRNLTVINL